MLFHHILSDLVSNFLKGSKRGFKPTIFGLIFLLRESLMGCNKNLCRHLDTFISVYLTYRKRGGLVEIVVVVCGKICDNMW